MVSALKRVAFAALPLAFACALCGSVALGGAEAATGKKPSLKRRTISSGKVNDGIPGASFSAPGAMTSRLRVGGPLSGLGVRDVDVALRVTNLEVAALQARLTAPNGATVDLVLAGFTSGPSWGSGPESCKGKMLVLDDETRVQLTPDPPVVPELELGPPYAGRSQPAYKPLFVMDGGPAAGKWKLAITNFIGDSPEPRGTAGVTGTLHCWELRVKPQIPPGG